MLITRQPTANETPDATLGGAAVTTVSNTGHGSTVTSAAGEADSEEKSARWFTFQSISSLITAITLKVDHTSSGALSGAGTNSFTLDYSLNSGSNWTNAVTRTNFEASQGPTTFSVGLSAAQDISQVQVRVDYQADSTQVGDAASVTATIANIKLEVEAENPAQLLTMM